MIVFGDVEFAQDHYCFLSTKATSRTITGVDWMVESMAKSMNNQLHLSWDYTPFIYTKNTSTPSESVVGTAIENLLDSQLAKSRCTHDAWLYCDI
jgi:hypothetical protein